MSENQQTQQTQRMVIEELAALSGEEQVQAAEAASVALWTGLQPDPGDLIWERCVEIKRNWCQLERSTTSIGQVQTTEIEDAE